MKGPRELWRSRCYQALCFIKEHPKCLFLEIANHLGVSQGLAVEISDELVRRGFITRGEVEEAEDDAE